MTIRRGFRWDAANETLDLHVNGTEVAAFSTTTTTLNSIINIGASGTEKSYTAGTPAVAWYFTNAGTSGSTTAEPFYVYSVLTGTGQVGGRCRFHTYCDVTAGGWMNALKSYMELGSSGKTTGLCSSACVELVMPNVNMGSGGVYTCLELEYVAGGTSLVTAGSTTGNRASFCYMNSTGDADGDFDDNGFLFDIAGLTAGTGHVLQSSATEANYAYSLRCNIGGTAMYLMLASAAG